MHTCTITSAIAININLMTVKIRHFRIVSIYTEHAIDIERDVLSTFFVQNICNLRDLEWKVRKKVNSNSFLSFLFSKCNFKTINRSTFEQESKIKSILLKTKCFQTTFHIK